jgi:AcrR family transcriptional regulator
VPNKDTYEVILEVAINLFSKKGYNSVTIKEIANEAQVSEMTVFRHFNNKLNLFNKSFAEYVYIPKFKEFFENDLTYNLKDDLLKISQLYQETMENNKKIILMELKNDELITNPQSPLDTFPLKLKEKLVNYFLTMQKKGLIKQERDLEALAINFLSTNFGLFFNINCLPEMLKEVSLEDCIKDYIDSLIES